MFETYQHILWDWNGTLFDDAWFCVSIMNSLLKRRNLPEITVERYQAIFDFPVRDYYLLLGFDFARDSFEDLSVEFMSQYEARRAECTLHTHARQCLAHIHQAGIPQSILSAYPQTTLLELVRQVGLEALFTHIIGLGDIYAHSKVDLGRDWMQQRGYQPSEVLLIGDTIHDFEVAQAIGADCVLVANGHNSAARLQQCGVRVVDSLNALVGIEEERGCNVVLDLK